MAEQNIERKIIIGMIESTEFLKEIHEIYSVAFIESTSAKRLASWCMEYFNKYQKAPGNDIEGIFFAKTKKLEKGLVQDIEDILSDLSEESIEEKQDLTYLIDETTKYFAERHLTITCKKVEALQQAGQLEEANSLLSSFKPLSKEKDSSISFNEESSLNAVEMAFSEVSEPLIRFPKQLGQFWNNYFIPGGLIGLMGASKRGKTFWLLYIAEMALSQGKKVAFFQAGDMSENQQVRRFCIYAAKRSDKEKYCKKHFQPVRDCVHNQRDTCQKRERECDFGVFENLSENEIRKEITLEQLKEAYQDNKGYKPCYNCSEYLENKWGAVWIREIEETKPLEKEEAKKIFKKHFIDRNRELRLSSHPNGTLTVDKMKSILAGWHKRFNFVPDIILLDYGDLLEVVGKLEERAKQNTVWKQLRNLSQTPLIPGKALPLVISPTQTDANSYDKDLLNLKNFSEDKRKYDHATAMFGLNQDPKGREKEIGIMRINVLIAREEEFNPNDVVFVLQNLKRGQPCLASYF